MIVTTTHIGAVAVVRVDGPRLTYPNLADFSAAIVALIGQGEKQILVDLSAINYVDSATIGCLMDLYRQARVGNGTLKLACVQARVETMLTMTGAQNFLEVHADAAAALASFGS